jgi:putative PIN family toxin of toxin-antitoxin system
MRDVLAEHELVTSDFVLQELRRVLRVRLRLPLDTVEAIEGFLCEQEVVPKPKAPHALEVRDPDDRWVLASAVEGRADVLVTGDRDLLDLGAKAPLPIVDPRGFWTLLRKRPPA